MAYAESIVGQARPLPTTPDVVLGYVAFSLYARPFRLDAPTEDNFLGGVRAWHERAKVDETGCRAWRTVW